MHVHSSMLIEAEDIDYIFSSLFYYEDTLTKYKQWVKTKEGTPLPGMEVAITQMDEDIKKLVSIRMSIYNSCYLDPAFIKK